MPDPGTRSRIGTILLTLPSPVDFPSGSTLSIKLYVRNTCSGNTHNSGTARLWYNDSAANSHLDATIDSTTSDYFLRDGGALATSPGPGRKKTIDIAAAAPWLAAVPPGEPQIPDRARRANAAQS